MYDHEYEWQILGFLRILKYIWQRNKSILADLVRDYRCGEIDTEDIFELSVMLLVEYICVDYLPEDDPNDFYGEEYTCYLLMESELDDYLTLIAVCRRRRKAESCWPRCCEAPGMTCKAFPASAPAMENGHCPDPTVS